MDNNSANGDQLSEISSPLPDNNAEGIRANI